MRTLRRRPVQGPQLLVEQQQPVLGQRLAQLADPVHLAAPLPRCLLVLVVHDDAVASALLGEVAGGVGGGEQVGRIGPARRIEGDGADAHRQAEPPPLPVERVAGEPGRDALGPCTASAGIRARQQQAELVAAQTGDPRRRSGLAAQHPCDLGQQLVARRVTAGVVDQLELVDVEVEQPGALEPWQLVLAGPVQQGIERTPVEQPGQGIVAGLVAKLGGELAALADVLQQQQPALLRTGLRRGLVQRHAAPRRIETTSAPGAQRSAALFLLEAPAVREILGQRGRNRWIVPRIGGGIELQQRPGGAVRVVDAAASCADHQHRARQQLGQAAEALLGLADPVREAARQAPRALAGAQQGRDPRAQQQGEQRAEHGERGRLAQALGIPARLRKQPHLPELAEELEIAARRNRRCVDERGGLRALRVEQPWRTRAQRDHLEAVVPAAPIGRQRGVDQREQVEGELDAAGRGARRRRELQQQDRRPLGDRRIENRKGHGLRSRRRLHRRGRGRARIHQHLPRAVRPVPGGRSPRDPAQPGRGTGRPQRVDTGQEGRLPQARLAGHDALHRLGQPGLGTQPLQQCAAVEVRAMLQGLVGPIPQGLGMKPPEQQGRGEPHRRHGRAQTPLRHARLVRTAHGGLQDALPPLYARRALRPGGAGDAVQVARRPRPASALLQSPSSR
ncbi:MAG: hypothetical protein KatS3mg126_2515 [Lysobacteraceae bacterium]|nr:MAG: hypothetical protein KatS3mg126_2515 [Xanthomonadaceae bacterium]